MFCVTLVAFYSSLLIVKRNCFRTIIVCTRDTDIAFTTHIISRTFIVDQSGGGPILNLDEVYVEHYNNSPCSFNNTA